LLFILFSYNFVFQLLAKKISMSAPEADLQKIEDELGDENSRTPAAAAANARNDYQKPGHLILTMYHHHSHEF
jgi:hypothetical protein